MTTKESTNYNYLKKNNILNLQFLSIILLFVYFYFPNLMI